MSTGQMTEWVATERPETSVAAQEQRRDYATRAAPRQARPSRAKGALVTADLIAVLSSMALALVLTRASGRSLAASRTEYLTLMLASAPFWLAGFARLRLYKTRFVARALDEWRRTVWGCVLGVLSLMVLGYMAHIYVARTWLVLVLASSVALVTLERSLMRVGFARQRKSGRMLRRVVIVGNNTEGRMICRMLMESPELGYDVVGVVDDCATFDDERGRPMLGTVEQTLDAVRTHQASSVIIAATAMDLGTSNRLIRELTEEGVHVELSSTLRDIASERLTVRPLGRLPVVYVEPVQRYGWRAVAKRTFDIVLSLTLLVITAPVLALVAVALKLDSSGPAIFKQERVGRDGNPFMVWKFRTMVVDAEARLAELQHYNEADGPLFKMKDDPRVTRVGRLLRSSSIDEVPQLWNVLRGEMSLVGPRPALAREVALWGPDLYQRLRVKPGMTGMWQVHGRSGTSFDDYARLDLYYVDNWSLLADVAILAKTIPAVLMRKGAY